MQIAITNGTGHFIEVAAVVGVGGDWYGLLSSESEIGFELKGDKVIGHFSMIANNMDSIPRYRLDAGF